MTTSSSESVEAELMQIGQAAERVGLSLRTVRFYEEMGLLSPLSRTKGGFRLVSEEDVQRLLTLKGMKPLGLTLEEIRELMSLLDRTEDVEPLDGDKTEELVDGLSKFAELGRQRVARLERHLAEGRKLCARIEVRLRTCRSALD